jgi:hypothetical protein
LLDAQRELTLRALQALQTRAVEAGEPPASRTENLREQKGLEDQARDRTLQGLPPPRAVYDVQNRNRIDWAQLPDWARPSDPEMFEGAHEG